jgi:hypothetical protein
VGLLAPLQSRIAEILRSREEIASSPAIEVIEENKGDLNAAVASAVSRMGIVVTVQTPSLVPDPENPRWRQATIVIEIQENVPINRGPSGSKRTWMDLAEAIDAELDTAQPFPFWQPLLSDGIEQTTEGNPVIANVTFTTRCAIVRET